MLSGAHLDRFLARVAQGPGCWGWNGAHTAAGYAETWDGRKVLYGHRVAYELWVGPIPERLTIDHLCRNPGCVNPAHLEAVTMRENILRSEGMSARHARVESCPQGHPYDDDNTYVDGRNRRNCRACWRLKNQRRWEREKTSRPSRSHADKTHCPQGHPYDETNTYYSKTSGRMCRACMRARDRARRARARGG